MTEKIDLVGLNREQLLELREQIDERLSQLLVINVKKSSSSFVAYWQEKKGQQKQKRLGAYLSPEELAELANTPMPNFWDFRLTEREREKAMKAGHVVSYYDMTSSEFYALHEHYPHSDPFKRSTRVFYLRPVYEAAIARWKDTQAVALAEWAVHGIGNLPAVKFLDRMKAAGHEIIFK